MNLFHCKVDFFSYEEHYKNHRGRVTDGITIKCDRLINFDFMGTYALNPLSFLELDDKSPPHFSPPVCGTSSSMSQIGEQWSETCQ